jgi:tetratricopeptide (TPR) repeat protein
MSGRSFGQRIAWVLGLFSLSLSLCLTLGPAPCQAAPANEPSAADVQIARRLFQRATADEELGRWESALKTLREIEAIKVTAGVLFHIAVCEQNLGRYVEALNDLGRAEELAQVNGDKAVLELVPARRSEIEVNVGHLRIEFIGPSQDVEVRIDGQRISTAALRVDIPLNPREHTIAVLRKGKPTVTRLVTVRSGSRQTERFDVTPVVPKVTAEYAKGQPPYEPSTRDRDITKKVVMYSAYALGIAGAGAGIYFVIDANKNDDEADAARLRVGQAVADLESGGHPTFVPNSECDFTMGFSEQQRELDEERYDACVDLGGAIDHRDRSESLAVWSFAIAGVGAIGGTAVLLFWPESKQEARLRLLPTLGGALISGSF